MKRVEGLVENLACEDGLVPGSFDLSLALDLLEHQQISLLPLLNDAPSMN